MHNASRWTHACGIAAAVVYARVSENITAGKYRACKRARKPHANEPPIGEYGESAPAKITSYFSDVTSACILTRIRVLLLFLLENSPAASFVRVPRANREIHVLPYARCSFVRSFVLRLRIILIKRFVIWRQKPAKLLLPVCNHAITCNQADLQASWKNFHESFMHHFDHKRSLLHNHAYLDSQLLIYKCV